MNTQTQMVDDFVKTTIATTIKRVLEVTASAFDSLGEFQMNGHFAAKLVRDIAQSFNAGNKQ